MIFFTRAHAGALLPPPTGSLWLRLIPIIADDGSGDNPLRPYLPAEGWVAYHGTSSAFADRIESAGLTADNGVWTPDDCRAVCRVFESLQWYGLTDDGYAVLGPWGPGRDISISGRRHIYLAETFTRASLYARVPLGETSHALVGSLEDLQRFEADEGIRAEHVADLEKKLRRMGFEPSGATRHGTPPPALAEPVRTLVNAIHLTQKIDWLEARNEEFRALRERLELLTVQHRPVVYAVLLDKATWRGGWYSPSMGIEVIKTIPPPLILAKAFPVAVREDDRMISANSPPGRFETLMKLDAIWEARAKEANA